MKEEIKIVEVFCQECFNSYSMILDDIDQAKYFICLDCFHAGTQIPADEINLMHEAV